MFFEVKNLCFSYYKSPLCLKDINFSFAKNDKVMIVATKEMGKTTFLKVLSGFETNYFGKIILNGRELKQIEDKDKNFSLLFSNPVFFERKTIRQNIEFQCRACGLKMLEDEELTNKLKEFKINASLDTKLKKLSLFEKRKLAIIRSLIKNPNIIFLDDQFEFLQDSEIQEMLIIYDNLLENKNLTILYTLTSFAFKYFKSVNYKFKANKILYLNHAKCYEFKTVPQFLDSCIDKNSIEFLNDVSIFDAVVFKENNRYFISIGAELEFEIDSKFYKNLDALDLKFGDTEDCEVVVKSTLNLAGFTKEVFDKLMLQNELFIYHKLDGSRLV